MTVKELIQELSRLALRGMDDYVVVYPGKYDLNQVRNKLVDPQEQEIVLFESSNEITP